MSDGQQQRTVQDESGWRYVFFGQVGPPHSFLTMRTPLTINMKHSHAPVSGTLMVTLERMQILVVLEAEQQFDDLYTLRNVVQDMTATITDCANVLNGEVYQVEVLSVHDVRGGRSLVFAPGAEGLAQKATNQSQPGFSRSDVKEFLDLAWRELGFRYALADFRSAIRYPGQTGFYCGRAVEALAHYFGPMDTKSNMRRTRAKLREALHITKDTDSKLIRASADARHGGGPWITDEDRGTLMHLTRELIFRFSQIEKEHRSGAPATKLEPI
jgi:hypothetical protein